MAFNITLEDGGLIKNLAELPLVVSRETDVLIEDMARWVVADLKQRFPAKTGALRASFRSEIHKGGDLRVAAFLGLNYGAYIDEGTGLYGPDKKPIVAKNVMVFNQHGQKWFHRQLEGIKPRNYTEKTFQASLLEADRQLEQVAERIIKAVIQ